MAAMDEQYTHARTHTHTMSTLERPNTRLNRQPLVHTPDVWEQQTIDKQRKDQVKARVTQAILEAEQAKLAATLDAQLVAKSKSTRNEAMRNFMWHTRNTYERDCDTRFDTERSTEVKPNVKQEFMTRPVSPIQQTTPVPVFVHCADSDQEDEDDPDMSYASRKQRPMQDCGDMMMNDD